MLRITNIWFVIKKCSVLSISFSFPYCSKSKCALFPDIYHILSLVLRFTFVNTRFWGKALKKVENVIIYDFLDLLFSTSLEFEGENLRKWS